MPCPQLKPAGLRGSRILARMVFGRTLPAMRSEHLTEQHLEALAERIRPMLNYLDRLERRMEKQGFPVDDRLLVLVREARKAVHDANLELHYFC